MSWGRAVSALTLVVALSACGTAPVFGPSADSEFEAGFALYEQGRYEDAIEHFNRAIDIDPEHAQSYLYLGRSLFHLGRWLEAVSYLRSAYLRVPPEKQREIAGDLLESLLKGAAQLFEKGNFANAIPMLREAVRLEPGSQRAKGDLGEVLSAFGDRLLRERRFNDAIAAYTEALDLAPAGIQSYIGLAKSLFQTGELSRALATVKEALRVAPGNGELESLLKQFLQGG